MAFAGDRAEILQGACIYMKVSNSFLESSLSYYFLISYSFSWFSDQEGDHM